MFELIWYIIILAFLFETMDSSAGMGFGTCLAPLLFLFGYNPLQVVPVLLISEAVTGVVDTFFDHEFGNVKYRFFPLNDSTKMALIIAFFGCIAIFTSIYLVYFSLKFSDDLIKLYVSILVLAMGFIGFFKLKIVKLKQSNPRRKMLIAFSVLAGFNKGIGGGGYGPVITMGEILSGVYEKSATAIVSFAESLVSITGIITFLLLSFVGIKLDLFLLPSIFTGGFIAALISPYLVRVLPNKIWQYIIPIYTIFIGLFSLSKIILL